MSPPSVSRREVVITGIGVVSPIGIGCEAYWAAMLAGRSGVGPITRFDASCYPAPFAAEVRDFDAKVYVRPRKSLKVMSREIQFGFAAADMAVTDAALDVSLLPCERLGVVFGADMIYCGLDELEPAYRPAIADGKFDFHRWSEAAMANMYPLWLLRNLPNMIACHVAIAHDARGPCNTISLSDISGLSALAEGARCIARDAADVMFVGGVGGRVHPTTMSFRGAADLSHRAEDPAAACRPFDADRNGLVNGEGAATFVLESEQHARKRGAKILGRIAGFASAQEPVGENFQRSGSAIKQAMATALARANLLPEKIGHVNAHGLSTRYDDKLEAQAIHAVLGSVPVTAPKSYLGHAGAGGGLLELVASLLALEHGLVPPTLNYQTPDTACPVNVVHGQPQKLSAQPFMKLSHSRLGAAVAVVIEPA